MIVIIFYLLQFLFCYSIAINLRQPTEGDAKVIAYDLIGARKLKHSGFDKRSTDDLTINGTRAGTLYLANITVGTPPQPLTVQVDTGSSKLILYSSQISGQPIDGTYNANTSSSYRYVDSSMNVSYASDTILGDYVRDTVTIGNATLSNMTFGVGYQQPVGTVASNTWGIGSNEGQTETKFIDRYTPYYMVKLGLISSPSYSLWLNDIDAPSGSLLFGGVDKSRYTGVLSSLPIVPDGPRGSYFHSKIPFNGLYINNGVGSIANATNTTAGSFPINVTLDSGSGQIYLPIRAAQNIYSTFNVTFDASSGEATCDCALASSNSSIGFAFGDTTIFVPMRSLVAEQAGLQEGVCTFNIWAPVFTNTDPNSEAFFLLGDPFLRSAYVVYDFSNYELSLAQSALNSTTPSQILEIMPGEDGTPNTRNITQTKPGITTNGTISPTFVPKPNGAGSIGLDRWTLLGGTFAAAILVFLHF